MRRKSLKSTGPMFDAGTMFARFRQSRRLTGPAMLCAEGFHVRTSAIVAKDHLASKVLKVDCGLSSLESFAFLCRDSLSWKTYQRCLFEGLTEFSGSWPTAGMMRNGAAYALPNSELPTFVTVCSFSALDGSAIAPIPILGVFWPTLVASHGGFNSHCDKRIRPNFWRCLMMWPQNGVRAFSTKGRCIRMWERGKANPECGEWFMGFPVGWTDVGD